MTKKLLILTDEVLNWLRRAEGFHGAVGIYLASPKGQLEASRPFQFMKSISRELDSRALGISAADDLRDIRGEGRTSQQRRILLTRLGAVRDQLAALSVSEVASITVKLPREWSAPTTEEVGKLLRTKTAVFMERIDRLRDLIAA
jgi:hypothetical protein